MPVRGAARSRHVRSAAPAVLLLVLGSGCGAPRPSTDAPDPCADADAQVEMNACWAEEADSRETEAERVLAETAAALDGAGAAESVKALRAAQQAWAIYRDAECALFQQEMAGGSAEPLANAICRERLARERVDELRRFSEARAAR